MTRSRILLSSWLFAPYAGSANTDIFKRLRCVDMHFDVVQVRGMLPELGLLEVPSNATFERHEVDLEGLHPRSEPARRRFKDHLLERFDPARHDAILSHSNEVPSHAAALALKQLYPETPWVAYFGDVVSRNPYVRHMSEYPLFEEDCFTEEQTLRHADVVICNNDVQAELMAACVPAGARAPMVVVPHAWDPALFPTDEPVPNPRFTFMHLGALYSTKRVARPVLEAVDLLLETYPAYEGRFEVLFIGDEVSDADLRAATRLRMPQHVRFLPGVRYLASLDLMRRADALVLIDGMFDWREDRLAASPFFPGKLADYLGSGRPILGVTMPKGPTASLLRDTHQPVVGEEPQHIAYAMKRMIDGKVDAPSPPVRLRTEFVGAQMELVLRAALAGREAVRQLPRLMNRLIEGALRQP